MERRDFLKAGAAIAIGSLASGAGSIPGPASQARPPRPSPASPTKAAALPAVRLGTLEVSRLILGSNPFGGYSHKSAQLDEKMRRHHTDERIMQIPDEAAECGLTALASPPDERWVRLWARCLENGGRLKIRISQCQGRPEQMLSEIDRSVKAGAAAGNGGPVEGRRQGPLEDGLSY